MRKAFIHIGTMKTGTTSIQHALAQNRAFLLDRGYDFLGWPLRHTDAIAPRLAETNPGHAVILSDEGLWHFTNSPRSDTAQIARLFATYDVKIIAYLRRPDQYLESWYLQGVKSGTGQPVLTEFLKSPFVASGANFLRKLEIFAKLFGKQSIVVRPYERAQLRRGDAVADFLHTVGIADQGFAYPAKVNTTPETAMLLQKSLELAAEKGALDDAWRARVATWCAAAEVHGPRHPVFTKAELTAMEEQYRPVFQQIQRQYGGGAAPHFFRDWIDPAQHPG